MRVSPRVAAGFVAGQRGVHLQLLVQPQENAKQIRSGIEIIDLPGAASPRGLHGPKAVRALPLSEDGRGVGGRLQACSTGT